MSRFTEKANTSSMTSEVESEYKLNNYYKTIIEQNNKKINTSFKKISNPLLNKPTKLYPYKSPAKYIRINNQGKEVISHANCTEEEKTNVFAKNIKKNRVNIIFNNLLIREKQKTLRRNTVLVANYNMYMKKEEFNKNKYVVNNNSSLFRTFINQTKSNFNNKYKVIYSISDWRQGSKVQDLFNSIKSYQHKNNFPDNLKGKLLRRCSTSKLRFRKPKDNIDEFGSMHKIEFYNSSNDYLKNIFHKNNLIKIKTIKDIKTNKATIRRSSSDIFYKNNTLFRTMPISKLKVKKMRSYA